MLNVPKFLEFVTIIPTFYSDLENNQALISEILVGRGIISFSTLQAPLCYAPRDERFQRLARSYREHQSKKSCGEHPHIRVPQISLVPKRHTHCTLDDLHPQEV